MTKLLSKKDLLSPAHAIFPADDEISIELRLSLWSLNWNIS